jgi:hypothetical protein
MVEPERQGLNFLNREARARPYSDRRANTLTGAFKRSRLSQRFGDSDAFLNNTTKPLKGAIECSPRREPWEQAKIKIEEPREGRKRFYLRIALWY